jgi:hypothetical protein
MTPCAEEIAGIICDDCRAKLYRQLWKGIVVGLVLLGVLALLKLFTS